MLCILSYRTKPILHVDKDSCTAHESTHSDSSGGHGTSVVISSTADSGTGTVANGTNLGCGLSDLVSDGGASSAGGSGGNGAEGVKLFLDRLGGTGKGLGNTLERAGVDGLGSGLGVRSSLSVGSSLGSSLASGLSRLSDSRRVGQSGGGTSDSSGGIAQARRDLVLNSGRGIPDGRGDFVDDRGSTFNSSRDVTNDGRGVRKVDGLGLWFVSKWIFCSFDTTKRASYLSVGSEGSEEGDSGVLHDVGWWC